VRLGAGMSTKISGFWEALTNCHRSESNSLTSLSEGVVGVQMLCFPFKQEEEETYALLDPLSIKWMDKNECKKLQRASK